MPFCAEQAKKKAIRDNSKSVGKFYSGVLNQRDKNKISYRKTSGKNFLQTSDAKIDVAFVSEHQNGAIKWLRPIRRIFSYAENV